MKLFQIAFSLLFIAASQTALAEIKVLACEPEWAALVTELGGDQVQVDSATTAMQDPHHIQARPSLISRARGADLLVCSGAELEVGWLPVLLRKSGNPKIQTSGPGYFMATDHVNLLDQRDSVDRSEGDVHAAGNPHIHLNPYLMLEVGKALSERLATIHPQQQALFAANYTRLENQLLSTLQSRQVQIDALAGKKLVVYHDSWPYLMQWLKMDKIATLEPKPGVPPNSRHLSSLVQQLEARPADMIIYAAYQNPRASQWLSGKTAIPAIAMPYSVDNWQQPRALASWYESLLDHLAGEQP